MRHSAAGTAGAVPFNEQPTHTQFPCGRAPQPTHTAGTPAHTPRLTCLATRTLSRNACCAPLLCWPWPIAPVYCRTCPTCPLSHSCSVAQNQYGSAYERWRPQQTQSSTAAARLRQSPRLYNCALLHCKPPHSFTSGC